MFLFSIPKVHSDLSPLEFTEEDAAPSTFPYKVKFTNGTVTDNGDGTTSISSGGGTPGGSDTQVQFNDGGSLGGDNAFIWLKTPNELDLGATGGSLSAKLGIAPSATDVNAINIDGDLFPLSGDDAQAINFTRTFDSPTANDISSRGIRGVLTDTQVLTGTLPNSATYRTLLDLDYTISNSHAGSNPNIQYVGWGRGTITRNGTLSGTTFNETFFGTDITLDLNHTYNNAAGTYNHVIYGDKRNIDLAGEVVTAASSYEPIAYGHFLDITGPSSGTDTTSHWLHLNSMTGFTTMRGIYEVPDVPNYLRGNLGLGSIAAVIQDAQLEQTIDATTLIGHQITGIASQSADYLKILNNTPTEIFSVGVSDTVINEGALNYDVRMESQSNANMFFLDASVNSIGINNSAPDSNSTFDVTGNLYVSGATNKFRMKDTNVAHGMTTIAPTNVYFDFEEVSSGTGGIQFVGLTDVGNGVIPLQFQGIQGDTTTTLSCLLFRGEKKSGTGTQALATTEILSLFRNRTTTVWQVLGDGGLTITQILSNAGTPKLLTLTGGAHTASVASTELIDVDFDLDRTVQFATGALATQRAVVFREPTYGFVGASTLTDAATVAIVAAPVAGTNATITNNYALWVDSGASRFDGRILGAKGVDVASAATLTLGEDGNYFDITGITNIDYITTARWTAGSVVYLQFDGVLTVNDSTATPPAGTGNIDITAAFVTTAGDTLTLVYDGGQSWREIARSIN